MMHLKTFHLAAISTYGTIAIIFLSFSSNDPDIKLSKTASSAAFGAAVVFAWSCASQLKRILTLNSQNLPISILALTVTTFISGATMICYIITITCPSYFTEDAFGVVFHQARYHEWLICVPLLGYATVLPENLYLEKRDDAALVVSLFLMMVFGLILQYDISLPLAILCLSLGLFFGVLSYFFLYKTYVKDKYLVYMEQTGRQEAKNERIMLKRDLSIALALMLPAFPAIYILSIFDILDADQFFIVCTCIEIISKGLFVQVALDSQLSVIRITTEYTILMKSSLRKQIFLKFILNEIGIPLQAIIGCNKVLQDVIKLPLMGFPHISTYDFSGDDLKSNNNVNNMTNTIDKNNIYGNVINTINESKVNINNVVIISNDTIHQVLHHVVHLDESISLIEDNLRNCRIFSMLEEKTYQLTKSKFKLYDMTQDIITACQTQSKTLLLTNKLDESITNNEYIGDWYGISHLVVYIILHLENRNIKIDDGRSNHLHNNNEVDLSTNIRSDSGHHGLDDNSNVDNNVNTNISNTIYLDVSRRTVGSGSRDTKDGKGRDGNSNRTVSAASPDLVGAATELSQSARLSNLDTDSTDRRVPERDGYDVLVFSISNEGESFTEQDMSDMFEPYSKLQGDNQHVDNSYYSSLKLAIGREIVLLHGGQIGISPKSKNGICNTISITIPFKKSTASFDGTKSGQHDAENPADMKNTYNVLDLVGTKVISPTDISSFYHVVAIALYIIVAALFLSFLSYKDSSFTLSHKSIFVAFGGAIAFGWSSVTQINRIWSMHSKKLSLSILVLQATALVNAITMVSYLATIAYPHYFHGDVFGVVTHHARYQGWLICLPLLGYATVLPENGYLERIEDVGLVVSLFLTIAFGFILHYDNMSKPIAVLCFVLSWTCWMSSYYFLYKSFVKDRSQQSDEQQESGILNQKIHSEFTRQRLLLKRKLSIDFALLLLVFPSLYVLSACKLMDAKLFFIVCTILEMLTKGIFAHAVLDSQLTLIRVNTECSMMAQESNRKHIFLKFLLHEIGVPLNAISMSTECIQSTITSPSTDAKHDVLSLIDYTSEIHSSARSIDDSLRNCNIFTQLEDKKFQLNKIKFRFRDMTKEIIKTCQIQSKTLLLINKLDESITYNEYIGDWYGISHLVVYIILHLENRNIKLKSSSSVHNDGRENSDMLVRDSDRDYYRISSSSEIPDNWHGAINLEVIKRNSSFNIPKLRDAIKAKTFSPRFNDISNTHSGLEMPNIFAQQDIDVIVFNISNEGESFTQQEMTDMFEPYSKLHKDGQDVDNSYYSSLKLAIGREIVLLHGGRVDISPKSNNGIRNVISITIPFKKSTASNEPSGVDHFQNDSSLVVNENVNENANAGRNGYELSLEPFNTHDSFTTRETLDESMSYSYRIMSQTNRDVAGFDNGAVISNKMKVISNMNDDRNTKRNSHSANINNKNSRDDVKGVEASLPLKLINSLATPAIEEEEGHSCYSDNNNVNTNNATNSTESLMTIESMGDELPGMTNRPGDSKLMPVQDTNQGFQKKSSSDIFLKLKVLVVDDTTSNRKMLQKLLQIFNVDSDTACDGKEAVDAVAEKSIGYYDIIFMDFTMPVMNGVEATRAIRDMGFKNSIIGVTANMMKEDFDMFYNSGADLVLSKPMKKDMLKKILDCYIADQEPGMVEIRKKISSLV